MAAKMMLVLACAVFALATIAEASNPILANADMTMGAEMMMGPGLTFEPKLCVGAVPTPSMCGCPQYARCERKSFCTPANSTKSDYVCRCLGKYKHAKWVGNKLVSCSETAPMMASAMPSPPALSYDPKLCKGAVPTPSMCNCPTDARCERKSFCTPPGTTKSLYVCRCLGRFKHAKYVGDKLVSCSEFPMMR